MAGFARYALREPHEAAKLPFIAWNELFRFDWWGRRGAAIDAALSEGRGYVPPYGPPGLNPAPRVLADGCALAPYAVVPDPALIDGFRRRFAALHIKFAVYVAPLSDCDRSFAAVGPPGTGLPTTSPIRCLTPTSWPTRSASISWARGRRRTAALLPGSFARRCSGPRQARSPIRHPHRSDGVMLFNSVAFVFVFLPMAVVGYSLAGRAGRSAAAAWLVACSLVFYAGWNPVFVVLLVGSVAFNYACARAIVGSAARPARQSAVLIFGIAGNLGLLFYYKYLFPLLAFLHGLGLGGAAAAGSVVLPLGISFFTFTQLGYLVDCKERLMRPGRLLDYALFVTFFPHLIAGPILNSREIMPQFADPATLRLRADNLSVGVTMFAFGLAKKVLVADGVADIANSGFAHPAALALGDAWQAALAYSLQLYFDFSGYSDMALGLALMFGIRFPLNFNSPYKATSSSISGSAGTCR